MKITTTKFGEIHYTPQEVVNFQNGLLGFETLSKFIFIDKESEHPFIWIQSIEDPGVAFVAINPYLFYPDYQIKIHREDHEALEINSLEAVFILTLVVVPASNPKDLSTNLLAPIVVNRKSAQARQIILTNSGYGTKHYLLRDMQANQSEPMEAKRVA
jgi:flagellar assembly factor FliW